jgi:MarR family transcriptional regulator for hemolysin
VASNALESDLAFLLSQASHALATELTARLAELGITPRAHCVLSKALGGEFTQTQVAEQCALDKTTMVVTLDALERDGLAARRPSGTDRRARIIALAALPERQREPFLDSLTRLVAGRLSAPPACDKPPRRRAPRAPATVP